MRLHLDLDLAALDGDAAAEAARILRYWAGAVGQVELTAPLSQPLMDSGYREVGTLRVTEPDGGPGPDDPLKGWLQHYLTRVHESLLWKIDGLGERDARWPRTPTGTNLLGLLKHVAIIESEYLGLAVGRTFEQESPWLAEDAEPNIDMFAAADETIGSVRDYAVRVWAHADATIEALPLDAPAHVPWWGEQGDTTLGRILVHVLVDVARHAGHADILRELIDGEVGLAAGNLNLPEGDAQWWRSYVQRLESIAEAAGESEAGARRG